MSVLGQLLTDYKQTLQFRYLVIGRLFSLIALARGHKVPDATHFDRVTVLIGYEIGFELLLDEVPINLDYKPSFFPNYRRLLRDHGVWCYTMSLERIQELRSLEELSTEEVQELERLLDVRTWEAIRKIVRPTCCEAAQKYPIITFDIDSGLDTKFCVPDDYDSDKVDGDWRVHPSQELSSRFMDGTQRYYLDRPPARFCPYCGEPLPKMVRKRVPPPPPVCRIIGDSGHCETCKERLHACICDPPEVWFEPLIEEPLKATPNWPSTF